MAVLDCQDGSYPPRAELSISLPPGGTAPHPLPDILQQAGEASPLIGTAKLLYIYFSSVAIEWPLIEQPKGVEEVFAQCDAQSSTNSVESFSGCHGSHG